MKTAINKLNADVKKLAEAFARDVLARVDAAAVKPRRRTTLSAAERSVAAKKAAKTRKLRRSAQKAALTRRARALRRIARG